MQVLYMSYGGAHGEHNAVMSVEEMKHFIVTNFGFDEVKLIVPNIDNALKDGSYWRGTIGPYLVAIVEINHVLTLLNK